MTTSMIKPIGYLLLRWRLVVALLGGVLAAMMLLLFVSIQQTRAQTTAVEPGQHYIAAGDFHSLAVRGSDGTVYAWGNNWRGELGNGEHFKESHVPVPTKELTDVVSVAGGNEHSLALAWNGDVYSWGWNDPGCQLGDGNPPWIYHDYPKEVADGPSSDAIAAGEDHSLALAWGASVYAWGNNDVGQLGIGRYPVYYCFADQSVPGSGGKGLLYPVEAIAAGDNHSLAVMAWDGNVYAWGDNSYGQLGNGSSIGNEYSPVQVHGGQQGTDPLTGVKAVAGGNHHSLALMEDGTVYAWGSNEYGQLGIGNKDNHTVPYKVKAPQGSPPDEELLTGIVAVAAGEHHSLALKGDGTVYAWGGNGNGQLGIGNKDNHTIPYQVKGPGGTGTLTNITDVAAGKLFSLALRSDGTVWAWGGNDYGQLGVNSDNPHTVPYQVHGVNNSGYLTGIGHPTASSPPGEPPDEHPPDIAICHKAGTPAEKTLYVPSSKAERLLNKKDYTEGACEE